MLYSSLFEFDNSIPYQLFILNHNVLAKRGENSVSYNLFWDKLIQNCLQWDTVHLCDNDLSLRQATNKSLHVLEAVILIIKKKTTLISCL